KLGVYHPTYLRQFYAARPRPASEPYAVQLAALIEDCYGSSDFWTRALGGLGYETGDTIANAEPLQRSWARENSLGCEGDDWLFEITAAQVRAFRPDVLIVADYSTFTADFLRRLRSESPSLRLVLGWCGAPFGDPSVFREWDVVLSCIPELVAHFRAEGHRSFHLDHAFEPRVLEKLGDAGPPVVNFSFIGSVLKQNRFHLERERILLRLVEQTDLAIWSDIERPSPRERRGLRVRRFAYDAFNAARSLGIPQTLLAAPPVCGRAARLELRPALPQFVDDRIARRARPPLFGLSMFRQLRSSRVTLNTHIDISPASASNMRLFEATGVGACLLTDWKPNLPTLFEPDAEVLTYRSPDECVEKVRYILEHEDVRRAVAAAGQRRTLRQHTFARRAERIDEIVGEALLKGRR
ncbi:MAG: spore maturation protein CgeB, partial [Acidobacteriota bacterium]|nr:spore maturation protein CgeB [Acidobacteriota bacterium]